MSVVPVAPIPAPSVTRILHHVHRYIVTTDAALAALFFDGDLATARENAVRLVGEGWLTCRYRNAAHAAHAVGMANPQREFYELTPQALERIEPEGSNLFSSLGGVSLVRALLILSFCCCDQPREGGRRKVRHKLLAPEVREFLPDLSRFTHGEACYYQEQKEKGLSLGLCWADAANQSPQRIVERCKELIRKQLSEETIQALLEHDQFTFTLVVTTPEKKKQVRQLLKLSRLPLRVSIVLAS